MNREELLLNYLKAFLTEERFNQLNSVLEERTRHFTVGLENIYQPHNSNAVIRSCDCFGIQDCHVIETFNEFKTSQNVSKGAIKWVDIHKYTSTEAAIHFLKNKGYRIVATSPHIDGKELDEFDITQPAAIFFGAEKKGLSEELLSKADDFIHIPMYGHTESLNISVSAAIVMQYLSRALRQSSVLWSLEPPEKKEIMLRWVKRSIKRVDIHLREFENTHPR